MKKLFNSVPMILLSLLILQLITACGVGKKTVTQPRTNKAAVALLNNGNQFYKKGCYERALESVFKAHELYSLADDQSGVAKSLNNIGNIYRARKDPESALLFFDEAVRIFKANNDHYGSVQAMSNKSAVYIDSDMFDEARVCLDEADIVSASGGFIYPPALNNRGIIFIRLGEYSEAEALLIRALAVIDQNNDFEFTAANFALGKLMVKTKQYKKAETYFMTALQVDRKAGFIRGIAGDLFELGSLFYLLENRERACDYLQRSLKVYTLLHDNENAEKSFALLKQAAGSVSGDMSEFKITEYFIQSWGNGNRLTLPCE